MGPFAAGPPETRTRAVPAVSTVEFGPSGDLVLTPGAAPSLRITAGRNVLGHLTSDVHGDRLALEDDGSVHDHGRVRYDLVLPAARDVRLSGSGSVQVAAPSALRSTFSINGSGDYSARGLAGQEAQVSISGSGHADVTVSRTLTATISDTITYSGDAVVHRKVTCSGAVVHH